VGRVELVVRWLAAGQEKGLSYFAEFTGTNQEGHSELRAREALCAHLTVGQQVNERLFESIRFRQINRRASRQSGSGCSIRSMRVAILRLESSSTWVSPWCADMIGSHFLTVGPSRPLLIADWTRPSLTDRTEREEHGSTKGSPKAHKAEGETKDRAEVVADEECGTQGEAGGARGDADGRDRTLTPRAPEAVSARMRTPSGNSSPGAARSRFATSRYLCGASHRPVATSRVQASANLDSFGADRLALDTLTERI
jgi:hypothetical protein